MGDIIEFFRNRRPGYTAADAASAAAKMNSPEAKRLDGLIEVTPEELNYLRSHPVIILHDDQFIDPPSDCA